MLLRGESPDYIHATFIHVCETCTCTEYSICTLLVFMYHTENDLNFFLQQE